MLIDSIQWCIIVAHNKGSFIVANSIEKHGFIVALVEFDNILHQILNLAREPYQVPVWVI